MLRRPACSMARICAARKEIALRASDIDVIYLNGYGFPTWRGGPICFADLTGRDKVLASIERLFHREFGARWKPVPLEAEKESQGPTG